MRGLAPYGPCRLAGLVVAILLAGTFDLRAQPAGEDVTARAFEIHFRELADAADVVTPLLTGEGTITLRPRLKTLVVQDRRIVLERVRELLEAWDLPPRNVEVSFTLFLGTDRRADDPAAPNADHGLSMEIGGVKNKIPNFTKWTTYEPLGSRSVTGTEGHSVVADLSDEYRVVFVIEAVHPAQEPTREMVTFEKLQLQRLSRNDAGEEAVENLYTAGLTLQAGRLQIVGAAKAPDSKQALFLALQTRPR